MEYQIGDFSKISRLNIKTLRYYHEIGLLSPTRIDEESGYRYYNEECLEKARIIEELKSLAFSLNDIKDIMKKYKEDSDILELMSDKLAEVNKKISEYKEIQEKLNAFIMREECLPEVKNSHIVVKELTGMLIASIRFKGKYSDTGIYIGRLYKYCGRYSAGKPFCLYYDIDYKEENADIEVCLPVSKEVNKGEVASRKLEGGRAVTVLHKGSYDSIGSSYKIIIDYLNENEIKTSVPSREIYLKGPGMIFRGKPDNYITEIQMVMM